MADAAVEFLLGNLKDLLLYHANLITETKSQVEELVNDLSFFRVFLKVSGKKRRKSESIQSLVRSIRDVVYEVEDIIDAFVTQATNNKSRGHFHGAFKPTVSLHAIGKQIESVRQRVEKGRSEFALLSVADKDRYKISEVQPRRLKDVVGFEDVVAAVEHLLSNLNDLLVYRTQFIINTKSQIEELEKDVHIFLAFLMDLVEKWTKSEGKHSLVHSIRDVVYDVEYVINIILTQTTQIRSQNQFVRDFKSQLCFHEIVRQVEDVRKKVEKLQPRRRKDVVGFEDVSTELIQRLTTETDYFDVISLTGMFGLGKTTLAWKIYNDPQILYEFPIRIWLSISQQFSEKDIFLAILEKFVTISEDLRAKDEQHLSQMVAAHLDNGKFLIVMDAVWSTNDWDRIRTALPANNKMGKVLITSRDEDLGKYASRPRDPTTLRFFNQSESWELLQLEALGHLDCPSDLQNVAKIIANDCRGLPLAVVVIGGILAPKYSSSDVGATRRAWEKVSTRVGVHLKEDPWDRMNTFISLSYDKLPYHLQPCFLYLGMFPEDYEIPVSKLIRMWIGEGFIQHVEQYSLEETAESYLEDLINRNLVRIERLKPNGKIKTCRIHNFLRDFCISEAGSERENFLKEIKCSDSVFHPPVSDIKNYRRIAIHSNCVNFLRSKPFGPGVRSFVCINNNEFVSTQDNTSAIPAAFKLLRVLDVKPIIFTKIRSDMYQLIHLRFIVLSSELKILPEKFAMLWNLQTLIVHTTSRTLEVKADILKIKQLRHFKTNASSILPKPGKKSEHGTELQTLGTISAESCTAELLHRAPNLLKLGIRGRLVSLFEGKIGSFNSLVKMRKLEKLELINDVYPNPASEDQLLVQPQHYQFPATLRSLTLCSTHFNWSYMSTLGLLENLETLKLKDKAFVGRTWEGVGERFHRLEFLHIDHMDLIVWQASSHHFPRLKRLVLHNCEYLLEIPSELAEIPSFQKLELHICPNAAASAKLIKEKKKEKMAVFNVSIFPATDDLP